MIPYLFFKSLCCGVLFLLIYVTYDATNIPRIMIDNVTAIRNVSDKFLSVALDASLVRSGHICLINSKDFIQRSIPLGPAYLRIGGTDANRLIFSKGGSKLNNLNCPLPASEELDFVQEKTNFTMSESVWSEINKYTKVVGFNLIFDLNVLLREGDDWDSSNAEVLLHYSNTHHYKITWQLGNEPNSFQYVFGTFVAPKQLGKDFKKLRTLLENLPEYHTPFIIGPDVTRPKHLGEDGLKFLKKFLCSMEYTTVNAVTWHQYYLKGKTATINDFINPATLDILEEQIKAVREVVEECAPSTPIWLSETSSASGGGAPFLSDSYVAGFLWLDKLGMAALLGINVVIRQTLYYGHYSLIDTRTLEPLPDWWLSVLYKKLVGQIVLRVEPFLDRSRHLRLYAHCSSREEMQLRGSIVTLFGMNLRNLTSFIDISQKEGSKEQQYISAYILTSSDLLSKSINLNGKRLRLLQNGTLPDLKPTIQDISTPIYLPPFSFGLWTIHGVNVTACTVQ